MYESQWYNQPYGSGVGPHNNYHFELAYAKLPVLVRYTFPKGQVRPVPEAGPTLGYALKLTTEMYFTSNAGVGSAPTGFLADNRRRLQPGLMGGAGIRFGYWQGRPATLLARCEQDTGWSEGVYFSTFSTHLYGLLTPDIGK